jgi:hypothetical protein
MNGIVTGMRASLVPRLQVDFLGESTVGDLHRQEVLEEAGDRGLSSILRLSLSDDVLDMPYAQLKSTAAVSDERVPESQTSPHGTELGESSVPLLMAESVSGSPRRSLTRAVFWNQSILDSLGIARQYPKGQANRAIFCSRTLNLRAIQAAALIFCW